MSIKNHFERELKIIEDNLKEGDNLAIKDFIPDIRSIIEKFSKQGHSGKIEQMELKFIINM